MQATAAPHLVGDDGWMDGAWLLPGCVTLVDDHTDAIAYVEKEEIIERGWGGGRQTY